VSEREWLPPAEEKLPRGHAYIRMRNKGASVNIDWAEVDSETAEKAIQAVMAIVREEWKHE
jgi:hypothetical protein